MNCFGLFGLTWLIQLLSVVQGMEGLGDLAKIFSMLSGGDDCRLRCPGDAKPKENEKHKPSSNGCGSFGIKLNVDEHPGFESCCNRHDICYDTCNSDRTKCDDDFKTCLRYACDLESVHSQHNEKKLQQCHQMVDIMHSGTVGLGCTAFKEAQRNACLCNGKKLTKKQLEELEKDKVEL